MSSSRSAWLRVSVVLILLLTLCLPVPLSADGGLIVKSSVWDKLSEGQQIAVITLDQEDTARVDLFISLYDESGESHDVTFFVPLGVEASAFNVQETTQVRFEEAATDDLDDAIYGGARGNFVYPKRIRNGLIFGWLVVNGGWSVPLAPILMFSAGCVPAPVATFETASSQLEVYDLQADTDLQALLSATGLSPAVQETLERLREQQIAVIQMRTQPRKVSPTGRRTAGAYGLHLRWRTALVPGERGATYAYPLGTGTAWAHPVEATRVYVVGVGTDFQVAYPRLGRDLSGYDEMDWLFHTPARIQSAGEPSYAIERATGSDTYYWRAIYLQSNSAEDILITRLDGLSDETQAIQGREKVQMAAQIATLACAPIVSLPLWVVAWWISSTYLLGVRDRWGTWKLWRTALRWGLWPTLIVGTIVALLYAVLRATVYLFELLLPSSEISPEVGVLIAIVLGIITWIAGRLAFRTLVGHHRDELPEVPERRFLLTYIVTVLLHSVFYAPLAFAYAGLIGVI